MSNLVEQNFQKGFNHNISVNEWLPFTEKKREIEKRARDKAKKKKNFARLNPYIPKIQLQKNFTICNSV